jgi:hypothetical protein
MTSVTEETLEIYLRSVSHYGFFTQAYRPFVRKGFAKYIRERPPKAKPKNPMSGYPANMTPMRVLMKTLSDTDDHRLLVMAWAIHILQSRHAENARPFLRHPIEAENPDKFSDFRVHNWELETLLTVNFNTPKFAYPIHMREPVDTREYGELADLINLVKAVEQDESKKRITVKNIMAEFHKISHRQFPWQIGWEHIASLYRHIFIYGQGECARYFEETYGLSVNDFVACAFALYVQTQLGPWCKPLEIIPIKVADGALAKTIGMVSSEMWDTRRESLALFRRFAKSLGYINVGYHPSYLRMKPLVTSAVLNGRYIAPFPEFVLMRATVGLFYDLIKAPTAVMTDARLRFEEYGRKVIKAYLPEFEPGSSVPYTNKNSPADTPDILLKRDGQIVAVFECKATKLSFQAQYSDDPAKDAKDQYEQIAKAVFQLWKFFCHVRLGIIDHPLAERVAPIVLTMEAFTQTSAELRTQMIEQANQMAATKEPLMTEADKRTPVFVSITELEYVLSRSTGDQLLGTFEAATLPQHGGWSINSVRDTVYANPDQLKTYPLDPGELMPWWAETQEKAKAVLAAAKGEENGD